MDFPISVPSIGLVGGKFADEDPLAGTPGSLIPAQWGNAVTEEILAVIEAVGFEPDEEDNTQLNAAINKKVTDSIASQSEAMEGVLNNKTMSPLRFTQALAAYLVQATEAGIGLARVATQTQTNAGSDDATIVTPKKLATRLASGAPVLGTVRNGRMTVAAASASATFTADEVVVKTDLGGQAWLLASFNKSVNLASIGAGGMDAGAGPVNGYVALYAIYNPTTLATALLAVNATSVAAPQVYGGASLPPGYTASALLTVVPTNGTGQFKVVLVRDRSVGFSPLTAFSTAIAVNKSVVSIAAVVPLNAIEASGYTTISASTASNLGVLIASDVNDNCAQNSSLTMTSTQSLLSNWGGVILSTPQQIVVSTVLTAGSPAFIISISGYKI